MVSESKVVGDQPVANPTSAGSVGRFGTIALLVGGMIVVVILSADVIEYVATGKVDLLITNLSRILLAVVTVGNLMTFYAAFIKPRMDNGH